MLSGLLIASALGLQPLAWPGPPGGVEAALLEPDPTRRAARLDELPGAGGDGDPALGRAISDTAPEVRRSAVALAARTGGSAVPVLIRPLLADADPRVRAEAVAALVRLEATGEAGHIGRLLQDSDEQVRAAAARALGAMQVTGSVAVLVDAVRDTRRAVVIAALDALGQLADADVVPVVAERLDDPGEDVAVAAIRALGRLPGDASRRALQRAAADTRLVRVSEAILSLSRFDPVAAARVASTRVAQDGAQLLWLPELLGIVARGGGVRALEPLTSHPAVEVRSAALDAAATLGEPGWQLLADDVARSRSLEAWRRWIRSGDLRAAVAARSSPGFAQFAGAERVAALFETPRPEVACEVAASLAAPLPGLDWQRWAAAASALGPNGCFEAGWALVEDRAADRLAVLRGWRGLSGAGVDAVVAQARGGSWTSDEVVAALESFSDAARVEEWAIELLSDARPAVRRAAIARLAAADRGWTGYRTTPEWFAIARANPESCAVLRDLVPSACGAPPGPAPRAPFECSAAALEATEGQPERRAGLWLAWAASSCPLLREAAVAATPGMGRFERAAFAVATGRIDLVEEGRDPTGRVVVLPAPSSEASHLLVVTDESSRTPVAQTRVIAWSPQGFEVFETDASGFVRFELDELVGIAVESPR